MKKGKIPRPIDERFWERVKKSNYCWEWIGAIDKHGYGRFWTGTKINPENRIASRASWEINVGPIPNGMGVLHTCDNRLCIRPDHLFIGDHPTNMKDMVSKKRSLAGIKNPNSKLSELDVKAIKAMCESNRFTQDFIAKSFKINIETVGRIHRNKNWDHLV